MQDLGDRMTTAFSRAVTRRRVLQNTLRGALATGAAMSTSLALPGLARANHRCTIHVSTWGCYCASTPFCGDSKCYYDVCTSGAQSRCNYWGSAPYCWCSQRCTLGCYGLYSCCDCWKYGQGSSCSTGNTACICKYHQCI